jgi:hypothetical protein
MSEFIGKYVCYGNDAGMFCWGRIKAECEINTVEGHKDAFIMDQRMSGPHGSGERIRKYKGDTILRKDVINLETDIFDRDVREFNEVTNDDLFLLVMDSEVGLEALKSMKSLGPLNMMMSSQGSSTHESVASNLLKKRLGMTQDDVLKV